MLVKENIRLKMKDLPTCQSQVFKSCNPPVVCQERLPKANAFRKLYNITFSWFLLVCLANKIFKEKWHTWTTSLACTWWPLKRVWKRVIWFQLMRNKLWIKTSNNTFWCVVSLSIFASCAVFWRARMASKNTNNAASEMLYNRTALRGFFTVKNVFNLNKRGRFTLNSDRLIILKLLLFDIFLVG